MKNPIRVLICSLVIFSAGQLRAQNFVSASTNLSAGGPNSVTVADVNGDGRLDLISPSASGHALLVFTNKGNGSFATAVSYNVGSNPYCVTAADLNREYKVDLVAPELNSITLTVLTNNRGQLLRASAP